jgi:hypothetical protein
MMRLRDVLTAELWNSPHGISGVEYGQIPVSSCIEIEYQVLFSGGKQIGLFRDTGRLMEYS